MLALNLSQTKWGFAFISRESSRPNISRTKVVMWQNGDIYISKHWLKDTVEFIKLSNAFAFGSPVKEISVQKPFPPDNKIYLCNHLTMPFSSLPLSLRMLSDHFPAQNKQSLGIRFSQGMGKTFHIFFSLLEAISTFLNTPIAWSGWFLQIHRSAIFARLTVPLRTNWLLTIVLGYCSLFAPPQKHRPGLPLSIMLGCN